MQDRLGLSNYASGASAAALASATVSAAGTSLALMDRTNIFLQGVTNLSSANFV
jgi:hypothetical protein